MALCNPAVEYNVAEFSKLSSSVHRQGGLSKASITSNYSVMVNNLAEKVDECALNWAIGVQLGL